MNRAGALVVLTAFALLAFATIPSAAAHGDESPLPVPSCSTASSTLPAATPGATGDSMSMGAAGSPSPASAADPATHEAHHATPEPEAQPRIAVEPCAVVMRIEVTLLDTMRMDPPEVTVPAGVPVTFVVANAGAIPHEFVLGDAADQQAHDDEMLEIGGHAMADEPNAIGVAPGETKGLTWVFTELGEMEAGCHVPGHYPAGMKMSIHVVG
jgi:uncharacterized cupredoxin-like copper-binding protein